MKHTSKLKNGHCIWDLNSKLRKLAGPVAAHFDLSIEDFLDRLTRGELPGQMPSRIKGGYDFMPPKKELPSQTETEMWLAALSADDETLRRIKRVAKYDKKSLLQSIWGAISGHIRCFKEDLILSPKTGEFIAEEDFLDGFIVQKKRVEMRTA